MKKQYDLVIFDFDGTLMDTGEGVRASAAYAIRKCGLGDPSEEEMNVFIGPPFNVQIARMYPLTQEQVWEVTTCFRDHYSTVNLLKARLYDGILETIDEIRNLGIKTAVATYKREDYARTICDAFHFTERMDAVEGCDFHGKLSKNDIIRNSIEKCGISDYSKVLMIGDTVNDSEGAKQLSVDFLGALYGYGFYTAEERESAQALGFVRTPLEVLEYL